MFIDMLNLPDLDQYDLSCLSTGYMAGAPCPQSIVKAVVEDLHMKDFVVFLFILFPPASFYNFNRI